MRVLLASITCQKGDLEGNLARHLDVLGEAREAGCDLAVFPELSLTGSVDPLRHPERAIALDHPVVPRLVNGAQETGVGALFGIGERRGDAFFISQVLTVDGQLIGVQRKRHLGDDEEGFSVSIKSALLELGGTRFGAVICAESGVRFTWDASAATGARLLFLCSAPGLYGRRTDEAGWRDGFTWWEGSGLADARHHARRLGVWVAMATQAGATFDEDFPGIAALIAPSGDVVDRLPDWRPGILVVDIPVADATTP